MSYFVYILECCDGSLYTGITTDVTKRLDEHNSSDKGAKYTKARRPVKLLYEESSSDRSSASKREYAIKKLTRIKKLQLINEPSKKEGH
ncbi:GIY-YIG nuclease family protein [Arcobacter sp. F2176]|jgi:putative endonuclease|uniref:GIY-YIG nuclease family protein n=1 Tax=Arcobacter sp. F2176 TaxID=2044511 RepID=UPI00100A716D|nr:GIY-YIG nuclease family protein [Arcobacter sp. F2176]RXJ82112.1 endonuclease [Arcobacter sp. F2176]|tara:strand:- start:1127 stop:1393 length:267 start_codon:yes stop_codon:yes gene_type:complete